MLLISKPNSILANDKCLDWFIPLNERHVLLLVREWAVHYNQGRPHKSLGPGIPDPPSGLPVLQQIHRQAVSEGFAIKKKSILGGLHHEYRLERIAA
jgi:putative transposase